MSILDNMVKGASSQFGREFGRAGANAVLKGKNHYSVKSETPKGGYEGRIKPSDSEIVKSIKDVKKIKFPTTDKGIATRLIEMHQSVLDYLVFKGDETLTIQNDINVLLGEYNKKYSLGVSLLSDGYKNTRIDDKRNELLVASEVLINESIVFIDDKLTHYGGKLKTKKKALLFSLFLGLFGGHKYYLKEYGYGVGLTLVGIIGGVMLLSPVWYIPLILWFINVSTVLFKSGEDFNMKYNPEYAYYNSFK